MTDTSIYLHDQIIYAIQQLLTRVQQISENLSFDALYQLNGVADSLYTLAMQGEEYKTLVLEGIHEDWVKPMAVIGQLKALLETGALPPTPTGDE